MQDQQLRREDIMKALVNAVEPLNYVNGMWQCGSAAFGRVDDWSDIDVILDVEDERVMDVFTEIENALTKLSPIENMFGMPQPMSPGAYQKVYKLEKASKFLVIEVCVIPTSSSMKFLEKEIHGEVFVHFDKKGVTQVEAIDRKEFAAKLKSRLGQIHKLFTMYQFLVDKELNRQNYIEAISFFQNFSLAPLLEVLRIKYSPFRYNFRFRYVYYDLPADVVSRLERYYFITDGETLRQRHEEVIQWFTEVMEELNTLDLEKLLS